MDFLLSRRLLVIPEEIVRNKLTQSHVEGKFSPSKMALTVELVFGIVHSNSDDLLWDIKPLVLHARGVCLLGNLWEIRNDRVWWWEGLVTLKHHVQQSLDMKHFVLESDPDGSADVLVQLIFLGVESTKSLANSVLVFQDFLQSRPLVGDFRVVVAVIGVIDVGIDASLKDGVEINGLCSTSACRLLQLDVEEGGDVAEVENACITQLDWLLVELFIGKHLSGDGVPQLPHILPIRPCGQSLLGIHLRESGEGQFCSFQHVQP